MVAQLLAFASCGSLEVCVAIHIEQFAIDAGRGTSTEAQQHSNTSAFKPRHVQPAEYQKKALMMNTGFPCTTFSPVFRVLSVLRRVSIAIALGLALTCAASAQVIVEGIQTQLAATGITYSGTACSPGTTGKWCGPVGIATDSTGNIYVAQYTAGQIVKIDAVTHAATVLISYGTTSTTVKNPQQMAMDSNNNLYIADQGNNRIVKYSTTLGSIVALYPVTGPFAVGIDASNNVWIGAGGTISKIPAGTASGTAATVMTSLSTGFDSIWGIAFDANGNMWIANNDQYNQPGVGVGSVYELTAASSFATKNTVFNQTLYGPGQIVFDSSNNMYIAEDNTNSVVEFPYNSSLTYGYNLATSYAISTTVASAEAVALDKSGNLFLTAYAGGSQTSSAVVEISTKTGSIGQVNLGSSQTAAINFIVSSGQKISSFQVLDQGLTGKEFTEQSPDSNSILCPTGSTAYASTLPCAINVVFAPQYPGVRLGAVEALDASGNILATAYLNGVGVGPNMAYLPGSQTTVGTGLNGPQGVGVDGFANVYIANTTGNSIIKVTSDGTQSTVACCTGLTPATLSNPGGVVVDGAGNLYIADYSNSRVVKIPWTGAAYGTPSTVASGLSRPNDVAVDGYGNVYIANEGASTVLKVPWTGTGYGIPVTVASVEATGVAVDANLNVYAAEYYQSLVVKIPWTGTAYGSPVNVGTGWMNPFNLSLDVNGNLYVADAGTINVSVVPWNGSSFGTQYVVSNASNGLLSPTGVSVDAAGDVFIADQLNNRIVKLSDGSTPSITFPTTTNVGSLDSADGSLGFTLQNLGNAPLTIAVPTSGTNPSIATGFAYDASSTCPQLSTTSSAATVAQGATCTYKVSFTPAAGGTNSGSLVLKDNNLNVSASTQTISLSGTGALPVSALKFGTSPTATITAGGNAGSAITVNEVDSTNATVTNGTASITLTVVGPNSYLQTYTVSASNGVATFDLSAVPLSGSGAYSYVASLSSVTSAVASETVNPGAATQIAVSGGTTSPTAGGNAGTMTATVVDTYGNTVTSYSGSLPYVLKDNTGTTVTSGTATVSSGVGSINLSGTALTLAGTDTVTVTGTSLTSGTRNVTVSTGAAAKIAVSGGTTTVTTGGNAATMTATVTDTYGNTVTGYSGSLPYVLKDNTGATVTSGNTTVTSGVGSIDLSGTALTLSGTATVTVTGTSLTSGTRNVTVNSGTATQIVVSGGTTSPTAGGNAGTMTATVTDTYGNTVTSYSGSLPYVLKDNTGATVTSGTATVTSGVGSINLSGTPLTLSGTDTVTVSGTSLASGTRNVAVSTGAAAQITVSGGTTTVTAGGNAGTMTATVTDTYGNTVTSYSGSLPYTLKDSTGTTVISGNTTITSGVGSINLSGTALTLSGTDPVTVTGTSLTSGTRNVTVNASTATQIVVSGGTTTVAAGGNAGTMTATVADQYGNKVPTYSGSLPYTFTDGSGNTLTSGTATITSGTGTIALTGTTLTTPGTETVTVTGTSLTTGTRSVTVNAGPATKFATTLGSTTINTGSTDTYSVIVDDAYGNTVPTASNPVTVTVTGPAGYTPYTSTTNASGGAVNFTLPAQTVPGIYTVTTTSGGLTTSISTYDILGPATGLTLSATPTTVTAGSAFGSATATIVDAANQPLTTQSGTVGWTLTGPAGFTTVSNNVSAANGAANISLASITPTIAGTYTLTTSKSGLNSGSVLLTVNPGPATGTGTPTGVPSPSPALRPGTTLGPVSIPVIDQYGNTVTGSSATITYTLTLPDGSTVPGTANAVNGVITGYSPALTMNQPGNYKLAVVGPGSAEKDYNFSVAQVTPTVSLTAGSGTLSYGSTLGADITASSLDGTTVVPGTWTYTATLQPGGTPFAVTPASVLPAGSYVINGTFTPTNGTVYKTTTTTVPLTISKIAPSILLTSTANPVLQQNATVLTATLASGVSTPTGTVNFYDNTASVSIGTGTIVNGVATLSIATLSTGTHSITAIYSGDGNFNTLTSTAVSQVVLDFTLTISTTAGSITSQTIIPGQTATYNFTITPTGMPTFPATVNLTVSGLPAGATYTLTPNAIGAGVGATPVILTVKVPVPGTASMMQHARPLAPFALALLLLPFAGRVRKGARGLGRITTTALLLLASAAAMTGLAGCGYDKGFFGQTPQNYTITVTGTSGSLTHSTSVTLTVE